MSAVGLLHVNCWASLHSMPGLSASKVRIIYGVVYPNMEGLNGDNNLDDSSSLLGSSPYVNVSTNTHSLDEEIEELDDAEYDIPPIETPPTLESILYESDNDAISDEEAVAPTGLFQEVGDCVSVASTSSFDSRGQRYERKPRKASPQKVHGSVIRHVTLRGISSQLVSAADRVHAGMPTAMAVSAFIAVGTSHGVVLVFDVKQALKWCLGGVSTGEQYGSVSSLGFNHNSTRLLVGFAKGQITMWDLTNGKILRTITDSHPPGTAILHIQFTDDPTLAVCSDSGGSVFELTFKRTMGVRGCDSRCIFSGSRGEVFAIQVLNMIHLKDHPLQDVCIVAMATLSKVIVVSIRPMLKVLFTHSLKANPKTLPILCWQFVVIKVLPNNRVISPVLAFGRENTIYFYQVDAASRGKIQFVPLQKLEVSYLCLNFMWLNSRTLVILDTAEHLHIVDVRTQEELEVLDLADVQLVYGSSYFKGLATGGNVSKAMALAGERSCYQSVTSFQGQLIFLGVKSVHGMALRLWNERIDQLVKQNRYSEALSLALSFYEDKAKAVVGLINKGEKKKALLAEKILELLFMYVEHAMETIPENVKQDAIEDHFLDVIPICIEYCIILTRKDILFERLYETFSHHPISRSTFLESLESHILNDSLTSITPIVLKDFVEHYEAKELFEVLENCIIHLNVETLDLHQVIMLCRQHGLYDAIIYIFTRGMGDYTTPFQELMTVLQKGLSSGSPMSGDVIKTGNKLLVYTSCCLAGRAYPHGNIPNEQKVMVKTEIFRCLTMLHTRNASDDEPLYPHLQTLLHFDTRELLNVMALSFEEPEFNKDAGLLQRQRLVDILLEIMVDGNGFTPSQVGALFTFLARQMAKADNAIIVNRSLFDQVLEYLVNPEDETRHAERQQALLELLFAGGLMHYDEQKLLNLAEKARFFQVCEFLHDKRREWHKIIACYLRDASRKADVFQFIERHLKNSEISNDEKDAIKNEVIEKIEHLTAINQDKAASMLITYFPTRIHEILERLKEMSEVQFKILGGLLSLRNDSNVCGTVELLFLNSSLKESYIRLMCKFEPHNVTDYVRSGDDFKLEVVLEIVQEYNIRAAVAYILEKMGDVHGAFAIMLENFHETMQQSSDQMMSTSSSNVSDVFHYLGCIRNDLDIAIQFCQRNSHKVEEAEREGLWLPLLEVFMMQHRKYGSQMKPEVYSAFKELTHHLLNSMMGYVKMSSILQNILQDPTYESSNFGEMKELLLGMLETYNYEMTLLSTAKNLVNSDLYEQLVQLRHKANHGSSHFNTCNCCGLKLNDSYEKEMVVLFRCGHNFHEKCLNSAPSSSTNLSEEKKPWICPLCSPNEQQFGVRERRINEHSQNGNPSPRKENSHRAKVRLEPAQLNAVETLKRVLFTRSKINLSDIGGGRSSSSFHNDALALRLASPPRNKLPLDDY